MKRYVHHSFDTPSRNGYNISPIVNRKAKYRARFSLFLPYLLLYVSSKRNAFLTFKIMNVLHYIKTIYHFILVHTYIKLIRDLCAYIKYSSLSYKVASLIERISLTRSMLKKETEILSQFYINFIRWLIVVIAQCDLILNIILKLLCRISNAIALDI